MDVANFRNYLQLLIFICLFLVSFSFDEITHSLIRFCIIVLVSSFGLQLIALSSTSIFGDYEFGDALGKTVKRIPVLSAVLWLLIVLSSIQVSNMLLRSQNDFFRAIIGGISILLLYFLIEQSAAYLHLWYRTGAVPMKSYLAWFVIGIFYHLLYSTLGIQQENKIATTLYFLLIVLFVLPYLAIK
jgi:putative membrane protein